ncbi:MAG TPA: class I SAM-dependent methyltransferase [Blastocatellia bacterium]|nr:class I SAM-dependent methyltransferase [Blastocatellia bacterium]
MEHQFAEQYAGLESWHWWFRGRQRILETVLNHELNGRESLAIASLGCGPASGLQWLERFAAPSGRIVGIDAEPHHAHPRPPRIEFIIGQVGALPLAGRSFDLVLALDLLEHLDDDAAGLRDAARLLKPGGLLLVTVPALPSLWGGQDVVSHHRRRYVKQTFADLFTRAGLPAPHTTYFNTLLFPPIAGVRWTRRALGLAERARSDFADSRPGLANELLTAIFAAEQHLVTRIPLPIGVSLMATLRLK